VKAQEEINRVTDLLSWWVHLIEGRSCIQFIDINQVSEGLAAKLLNAFYDLQLVDLNALDINHPGIDLGDERSGISFQISSTTSNQKIYHSLKTIRDDDLKRYVNGVRFFFLTLGNGPKIDVETVQKRVTLFDPARDILTVKDLIRESKQLYFDDAKRFQTVKEILEKSLGAPSAIPPSERLKDLPLEIIPPITALPKGSRMPYARNPLFVGHEEDLKGLAAALKGGRTAAIGQIAAVSGMGGIGKTQLAVEFVHHYGQFFAGVFWLNFGVPGSIPSEVALCGGKVYLDLHPNYDNLKEQDQIGLVLAHWQNGLPWLLVFDNCEDEDLLNKWYPTSGASRVVVTSRCAIWSPELGIRAVHVDILPRPKSVELLQKLCPGLSGEDSAAIALELGDLPLALYLAGSYMAKYGRDISPAQYLEKLRKPDLLDHYSFAREEKEKLSGHDLHVARTFSLSLNRLQESEPTDKLALLVLAIAACLAPGTLIPRSLLFTILRIDEENENGPHQVTNAINCLRQVGLIEEIEDGCLLLHRLLALYSRSIVTLEMHEQVEIGLGNYSNQIYQSGLPAGFMLLEAHLLQTVEIAELRGSQHTGALLQKISMHYFKMARYKESKALMLSGLVRDTQRFGPDHPVVATDLNNLAALLQATNRLAEAEPFMKLALALDEKAYGPDHPDVARDLNNLAQLLQTTNRLAEAEPLMRRALDIDEKNYGRDHQNVATVLNNLATLLQATNRLAEAEPLMRRALDINEKNYGRDHPNAATVLNNLATLLQDMNRLTEAEPLLRRAVSILTKHYGENHPDTAATLNNLAALLQTTSRLTEAEPLLRRVVDIWKKLIGEDHPNVATVLNNLAQLLQATNRLAEAEPLMRRALAIDEASYGPDHPEVGRDLYILAVFLHHTNRLGEAEPMIRRALKIFDNSLGSEYSDTVKVKGNLRRLVALLEKEPR